MAKKTNGKAKAFRNTKASAEAGYITECLNAIKRAEFRLACARHSLNQGLVMDSADQIRAAQQSASTALWHCDLVLLCREQE